MTMKPGIRKHHHGNLRSALIQAGMEILAESGLPGLTLRACAARAGVSHAAPAHHFEGLNGLLCAIANEGYRQFRDEMLRERNKADDDAEARLNAICRGYVNFAESHPDLFTLMFNAKFKKIAGGMPMAAEAYAVLSETCSPFLPVSALPESTELLVWSLVHGFASLKLSGRLNGPDGRGKDLQFDLILPRLTLRGS